MSIFTDVRDEHIEHLTQKRGSTPPPQNPVMNDVDMEFLEGYIGTHKLEVGAALLAGGIAYMARENPQIAIALINGAVVTIGNVLDVPGEVTSIGNVI